MFWQSSIGAYLTTISIQLNFSFCCLQCLYPLSAVAAATSTYDCVCSHQPATVTATSSSHCTTANKLLLWKLFSRKSLLGFKLSFICCKSFCSQMRYIYIYGEKSNVKKKKNTQKRRIVKNDSGQACRITL